LNAHRALAPITAKVNLKRQRVTLSRLPPIKLKGRNVYKQLLSALAGRDKAESTVSLPVDQCAVKSHNGRQTRRGHSFDSWRVWPCLTPVSRTGWCASIFLNILDILEVCPPGFKKQDRYAFNSCLRTLDVRYSLFLLKPLHQMAATG
jgi:hypothetical protein